MVTETFIEYGISYGGREPGRYSWTPEYDTAMRDASYRQMVHEDTLGKIAVVQRVTTITSDSWEPAIPPKTVP